LLATVSCVVGLMGWCRLLVAQPDLRLAAGGETLYVIVRPESPSPIDKYAIARLVEYLGEMTGAEFPVVNPEALGGRQHAIFVGVSAAMTKRLGEGSPVATLAEQEHVSRSMGSDIFLYGKGIHANLHAVMEFLETSLGWRWYSVYEKPVIPRRPTVTLDPFHGKRGFSFTSREVQPRYQFDFYYQHGINMGMERRFRRTRREQKPAYLVSYLPTEKFVHSSFAYIPPRQEIKYAKTFPWLERRNYFETNPEFFSLWTNGKRVGNRQLCFSNPGLRKELTSNVRKHIEVSGDDHYITIDAADTPGKFCHCPGCQALEKEYRSPGGPLYDYALDLCATLKREHPGVFVKILAYRRSQTQKPPVLPEGDKLPDNLIVSFAAIEDCFFADWTHPDPGMQESYQDLVDWAKIVDRHLWVWVYPNPWGTGAVLPVGNIERLVNSVRKIHEAGGTGVFTDHNGMNERAGLSELQSYVLYKLMQNVDCDADAVIREFTDHQYGPAAPLARTYLAELEQGRRDMTQLPPRVRFSSRNFDDTTFPYLTLENIQRWQVLLEQMEARVAEAPNRLLNVRLLRRELDFAVLWKWFDLRKAYPDTFTDLAVFADRIRAVNTATAPAGMKHRPLGGSALNDFLAVARGGGVAKPLPPPLAEISPERVKQYVPRNYAYTAQTRIVADPDAAFGYAATVHKPDYPLQLGFWQWKTRHPPKGTHGPRLKLAKDRITPGVYTLYDLGEITVTADSWIWFSAQSWGTHLEVGTRVYEPGEDNKWHAYVSIKFDGPTYGGDAEKDEVLVDRVILISTSQD